MQSLPFKSKYLYLLALFQLVAGPLVLMQVSVFCSLTVREAPRQGVAKAMAQAWKSETFQSLLAASSTDKMHTDKGSLPSNDDKAGNAKAKVHLLAWQAAPMLSLPPAKLGDWQIQARAWTPAWPQAPPGTPPRVG